MQSRGRKPKTLVTILGSITLNRSVYECPACHRTRIPADELLDVNKTKYSPGCRRLATRAGAQSAFAEGAQDLWVYAHIQISPKEVERISKRVGADVAAWQAETEERARQAPSAVVIEQPVKTLYVEYDGTGVPMTKREVDGRKGKQDDGSAKTREAFLGCVFTSTANDADGFPIRDPESTTYVGGILSSNQFGPRICGEAIRRGMAHAKRVAVIADGAKKNWSIAETHFPRAIWIVDLYHAREHLYALLHLLAPDASVYQDLKTRWLTLLDEGRIEELTHAARLRLTGNSANDGAAVKEINYFDNNIERMRYANFRAQGLFVGSGVMEAGCKTLVGKRLKQPGMFWTVGGANSIIALRSAQLSNRINDFWEDRSCKQSQHTDSAALRAA